MDTISIPQKIGIGYMVIRISLPILNGFAEASMVDLF